MSVKRAPLAVPPDMRFMKFPDDAIIQRGPESITSGGIDPHLRREKNDEAHVR